MEKRSWKEFKDSGLLWWINRTLHLFGWVIVIDIRADGSIIDVYPARCLCRGFSEESEENGFKKLTNHMNENILKLMDDINKQ
jgi:hypothetical protein